MTYNQFRADWSSPTGASLLADTLRDYWRAKGYRVNFRVVEDNGKSHAAVYGVRSDMVAGLPRGTNGAAAKDA